MIATSVQGDKQLGYFPLGSTFTWIKDSCCLCLLIQDTVDQGSESVDVHARLTLNAFYLLI